jgi:hypothetical protein
MPSAPIQDCPRFCFSLVPPLLARHPNALLLTPDDDDDDDDNLFPESSTAMDHHRQQGVLWKRRDIFKNRWRPRWFVVHPSQGVLTYYILTTTPASWSLDPLVLATPPPTTTRLSTAQSEPARTRATSWDSAVSEHSIDYDVVPRGTIDLLGCNVFVNDALSKGNLYAFTIQSPAATATTPLSGGGEDVHLAARTAATRDLWVQSLMRLCRGTPQRLQRLSLSRPRIPATVVEDERRVNGSSNGNNNNNNNMDDYYDYSNNRWKSQAITSSVYANVPHQMVHRIRRGLDTYLPMCDQPLDPSDGWTKLFSRTIQNNPHVAHERHDGRRTLLRTTAILNHAPLQIFDLLWMDQRHQFWLETNVRCNEQLTKLNDHTFLDCYAYNAVRPSRAREFTVVRHWQVVRVDNHHTNDTDEPNAAAPALCLYSSSRPPETSVLVRPAPDPVRATRHVSMYVLRPVAGTTQCHLTHFVSWDLDGSTATSSSSSNHARIMLAQQANLPAVMAEYLHRHEPGALQLRGPLTNAAVVEQVIKRPNKKAVRRRLTFTEGESFVVDDNKKSFVDRATSDTRQATSLESQAVLLLGPLVLYFMFKTFSLLSDWAFVIFCSTCFTAVRQVVLLHIGEVLPKREDGNCCPLLGPVTCRFTVDLKGVLRFIANKKEERDEQQQHSAHGDEVSVVHLVATAVAKAWSKEKELRLRRVCYPMLLIDELVDVSSTPVNVSVSENAGGVVTLEGVDRRTVQSVADELNKAEHEYDRTKKLGECLILATPDSDESEMETDAAALPPDVAVVAVVGGVRMEQASARRNWSTRPPMLLSVSLTVSIPHLTDVVGCRRYAEEVKKLLQFPEMCDG